MNKKVMAVGLLSVIALTGCTAQNSVRDLEGVPVRDPQATIFNNVDGYPNIVRICIAGVGFATTTRDYLNVYRIPEWDSYCATHLDKPMARK